MRQGRKGFIIVVALAMAACAHNPPPGEVEATTAEAPPARQAEVTGRRPHEQYVWVAGYWNLVNGRHVWVPGYWAPPPRGYRAWVPARWVHTREGWVLYRGHWR